jgi:PAS domain S-box-containing protein
LLVVDDDPVSRRVLRDTLLGAGFDCHVVDGGAAALAWLEKNTPRLVLLDLVMPAPDGYAVLKHIRAHRRHGQVPVVILTALDSDAEIERIFNLGADDYVHKPFRTAELIARVRVQTRLRSYVERLDRRDLDRKTVLELTQTLASSLDMHEILFTVVRRVAEIVHVDRCSIVLVGEDPKTGFVVATSDDEQVRDLPIHLGKYPEVREVLSTRRALVIGDVAHHPLLEAVRQSEPGLTFSSMALVPILHESAPLGVLCLRGRHAVDFAEYELSLCHTIANATGIALRNARILRDLKNETRQVATARVEAERRVQLFQRYADFFESAADGMVVIDRSGRVLFANPRAREITGHSETQLMELSLTTLVSPRHVGRAERLLRGFSDGLYPRGVDIELSTRDGGVLTANVSFSSVLHEDDAVLLTFRDVTRERNTAIELEQTKEFLERVIESSVDGIVSADLEGRILLFNRAASRLFGYDPSEVLGKRMVEQLYPPGVAREVMRRIRDPEVTGPGVLEDCRVDMLARGGERIQVTLSASLVMDGNQAVGSVGIFTDIRERLAMEARLSQAQDELRSRERQAVVAELAGAAAHELNQPLTSVIGYAELLRRKIQDPTLCRGLDVIIAESERMAEIVRKVGRITRYETKNYVGGTKIVDLEKASAPDDPEEHP